MYVCLFLQLTLTAMPAETPKHRIYSLEEAKAEIERLIEEMVQSSDQSIHIQQEDERLVIMKVAKADENVTGERPHSQLKGKIWIADDFDDELPEEMLNEIYGE
mgnify:CR=1 FL=1